jgi:hypothetical protein
MTRYSQRDATLPQPRPPRLQRARWAGPGNKMRPVFCGCVLARILSTMWPDPTSVPSWRDRAARRASSHARGIGAPSLPQLLPAFQSWFRVSGWVSVSSYSVSDGFEVFPDVSGLAANEHAGSWRSISAPPAPRSRWQTVVRCGHIQHRAATRQECTLIPTK